MTTTPLPPRIPVEALLKGAREIVIVHAGQDYRLRLTSTNKLILTK
jgi:hemin uptake protein HemP